MNIPYDKKWILIEKEAYANYLFVATAWQEFTYLPKKWGFEPAVWTGAEYIDSTCSLMAPEDDYKRINDINFKLLFTNPEKWDELHKLNKKNSDKLFKFSRELLKLNPQKLTDKQLVKIVNDFEIGQASVHVPRGPMWMLETPENKVSNYLRQYLEEKYQDGKKSLAPAQAFQILSSTHKMSIWAKEKEELAGIALIKKELERNKALVKHTQKYKWLEYGLQGNILDESYFRQEMEKIRKSGARKFIDKTKKDQKELREKQKSVTKEYEIDKTHTKIFKIVQESLFVRLYSKDAQFFSYYVMENIFEEIGRRSNLTLEQVRFLAPEDFKKILINKKDFRRIADERQNYSFHISDKGKTEYYIGKKARDITKKIKLDHKQKTAKEVEEINGQSAFNGQAKGVVKIINVIAEMVKMHEGNILVSHMTSPSVVPAMKKAGAIITDVGGITCHAAIVARELKKPCVIGTKVATEVLKDGDIVEVDATKGLIKKIK